MSPPIGISEFGLRWINGSFRLHVMWIDPVDGRWRSKQLSENRYKGLDLPLFVLNRFDVNVMIFPARECQR